MDVHKGELGAQHIGHMLQVERELPMSLMERVVPNRAAQSTRVARSIFCTRSTSRKSTVSFQVQVGIGLQAPGPGGGGRDGLHALGAGDEHHRLARLLAEVDHQVAEPAHGAHQVDIHLESRRRQHLLQHGGSDQELLVPVHPQRLHHVEVGAGQLFGQLLVGAFDELLVGHVVELLGELEALAHPAGSLKDIVVVQGDVRWV